MKTIGYIRVSSQEQVDQGASLDRQREQIERYCAESNMSLVEIISDDGISGYKDRRPGFLRLQEICKTKKIECVVVYDLSRLSRSVRTTLEFIEDTLDRNGISFVSLKQKIDTKTPSGKAFLAISAVFNQLYRDEIAFKTKAAIKHKQSKNEYIGGYVPYGYSINSDAKSLSNNVLEASVIDLIRDLRSKGMSYRKIAAHLNKLKLQSKTGCAWRHTSVAAILSR